MSIVVFQAQPALAHARLLYIKALPPGKASTGLKESFHPFPRAEEFKIAISPLAFVDRHFTSDAHPASGAAIGTIDRHAIAAIQLECALDCALTTAHRDYRFTSRQANG